MLSLSSSVVGMYLKGGPFATFMGLVLLHPKNRIDGVAKKTKTVSIHILDFRQRNYRSLFCQLRRVCIANIK